MKNDFVNVIYRAPLKIKNSLCTEILSKICDFIDKINQLTLYFKFLNEFTAKIIYL